MIAPDGYRFLATRWERRFIIVPLASIVRVEAFEDRVRIFAERAYPHRETMSALCARLPSDTFARVHRSHAVNLDAVLEIRPRRRGEYTLSMRDGSVVVTGRAFRTGVEVALGSKRGY